MTANYTISNDKKELLTEQGAKDFEIGVAWYNYEFSKKQKNNVFSVMQNSNRLNMNTKTSLGIKAYINLYTHLI